MTRTPQQDLHNAIMNLPCEPSHETVDGENAYKRGHRDARHAAAELVAGATPEATEDVVAFLAAYHGFPNRAEMATALKSGRYPEIMAQEKLLESWKTLRGVTPEAAQIEKAWDAGWKARDKHSNTPLGTRIAEKPKMREADVLALLDATETAP